ncbi:unnamed protein product [Coffea canephora]|uniref:DH200=94 genomic scaffold, scaffold_5440 n=1 Tax=Coffea canephora TaxID=49390 RepID=A0A068VLJ8_COFCA|nr:unnamed protein product [Coffea canephora]
MITGGFSGAHAAMTKDAAGSLIIPQPVTADGAVIKDQIIRFLRHLTQILYLQCLVQFWGLVKNEDKTYLTTRDQPFALLYYCLDGQALKRLCEYRKHCLEYSIPVAVDEDDDDHEIGPPGRVFRSGLPEHVWDVGDYTSREYPQRDYAVGRVKEYWALPIYHHPTQHLPIGVLEFVFPYRFNGLPRPNLILVDIISFVFLFRIIAPPPTRILMRVTNKLHVSALRSLTVSFAIYQQLIFQSLITVKTKYQCSLFKLFLSETS